MKKNLETVHKETTLEASKTLKRDGDPLQQVAAGSSSAKQTKLDNVDLGVTPAELNKLIAVVLLVVEDMRPFVNSRVACI